MKLKIQSGLSERKILSNCDSSEECVSSQVIKWLKVGLKTLTVVSQESWIRRNCITGYLTRYLELDSTLFGFDSAHTKTSLNLQDQHWPVRCRIHLEPLRTQFESRQCVVVQLNGFTLLFCSMILKWKQCRRQTAVRKNNQNKCQTKWQLNFWIFTMPHSDWSVGRALFCASAPSCAQPVLIQKLFSFGQMHCLYIRRLHCSKNGRMYAETFLC